MKKISWVTHKNYDIPLPENHKFTASKFSDLYNELKISDFYHRANILNPEKASVDDISICHDLDYVLKIKHGSLSDKEIKVGCKNQLFNTHFGTTNQGKMYSWINFIFS